MKTTRLFFALGGMLLLANCTTVEQQAPAPRTLTTTTEQTTVNRPYTNSVDTQTTRTYQTR